MSQSSAAGRSSDTTIGENWQHISITDLDEQAKILGTFFYTVWHFFGDIRKLFSGITDPRQPKKITYQVGDLAFAAIFMFMCSLQARRQGCGPVPRSLRSSHLPARGHAQ